MSYIQEHGGLNNHWLIANGINPQNILDFSVNINPYPIHPKIQEAFQAIDLTEYPEPSSHHLRSQIALKNQVDYQQVLVGNGAAELIWLISHVFLKRRKVLIVSPTFGEYRRAAKAVKAYIDEWIAQPPHFSIDLEALEQMLMLQTPHYVILCNPNNPTGYWLKDEEIRQLAITHPNIIFILDESYRSFVFDSPFSPPLADNIIHLRSMTKDFALAGLRIGYLLADPSIVQKLQSMQPPWSVNAAAQAAALTAIENFSYVQDTIKKLRKETQIFKQLLIIEKAVVVPSATHFFLICVSPQFAKVYWEKLLQKGFLVRDCTSFGLPHHLRVSTKLPHQNSHFINAWQTIYTELTQEAKAL